jgi:hypothetical protein
MKAFDIVNRLRFDATRCELHFSKGVASNIEEAATYIEQLRVALSSIGFLEVTNLGSEAESGRPPKYFECRLCGDWNDEAKHIEHADGCTLRSSR